MSGQKKAKARRGAIDRSETFDEFLEKEGLLAETEDAAIKEIISDQIKVAMDEQHLSKSEMAVRERLRNERTAVKKSQSTILFCQRLRSSISI